MLIIKLLRKIYSKYKLSKFRNFIVNSHHNISKIDINNIADMRKHGFTFTESQTFDLINNDYREYISSWEAYQPRLKDGRYFPISDDKYLFSLVFGNYVRVPENYALINDGRVIPIKSEKINANNLYDYLVKLPKGGGGTIKDRGGCDGYNVYVFSSDGENLFYKGEICTREKFAEIINKFKSGIVQEKITQGKFESAIFDKSINTVRIISIRKTKGSGEHEIFAAVQRIGTNISAPVDNFSQGGGSAIINLETGELGSMKSITLGQNCYDYHPDTGAKIKGLIIPGWADLKRKIIDLTAKLPFFDFIAWDIVIQDDGFAVIEINMKSTLNLFQIHGGLRNSKLGQKYAEMGYLEK
ncbi:MAG: hypothetical protein IJT21_10820 [Synergistaceae bacterium]|nr:hypothetical protein [Synergistaceae bacterium]